MGEGEGGGRGRGGGGIGENAVGGRIHRVREVFWENEEPKWSNACRDERWEGEGHLDPRLDRKTSIIVLPRPMLQLIFSCSPVTPTHSKPH